MQGIFSIIAMLGIITMALANVGGIGYGLYLWGGTGMAFGAAAWAAFKVWLVVIFGGLFTFVIGVAGSK